MPCAACMRGHSNTMKDPRCLEVLLLLYSLATTYFTHSLLSNQVHSTLPAQRQSLLSHAQHPPPPPALFFLRLRRLWNLLRKSVPSPPSNEAVTASHEPLRCRSATRRGGGVNNGASSASTWAARTEPYLAPGRGGARTAPLFDLGFGGGVGVSSVCSIQPAPDIMMTVVARTRKHQPPVLAPRTCATPTGLRHRSLPHGIPGALPAANSRVTAVVGVWRQRKIRNAKEADLCGRRRRGCSSR